MSWELRQTESPNPSQAGSEGISFQKAALSDVCPLLEAAALTLKGGGEGETAGKKNWPIKVNNPRILMDPTASE